jgi:DNA-binding response OmpR family regulator
MLRLQGARVLLVDDDRDVLESMEAAFRLEGARTVSVADGNEAVRACQDSEPDLVVLDMMLPGRSGFLVLEKIKGYEDSPAVIMLTANQGRRHQAYAESLGVDRYMIKPVPLQRLIEVSAEVLAATNWTPSDAEDDDPEIGADAVGDGAGGVGDGGGD